MYNTLAKMLQIKLQISEQLHTFYFLLSNSETLHNAEWKFSPQKSD